MDIRHAVPLKDYSTMQLGGTAKYLVDVADRSALEQAITWAKDRQLPIIMIGEGSNIIWKDGEYDGLVIVNKIKGFEQIAEDDRSVTYRIGAGEIWDDIVEKTARLNLYGIECLSLIPGTAGATPVQNVGAYGQDISQTLIQLEAYDLAAGKFIHIQNADCEFDYRSSRFKTTDHGKFFIVSLDLKMQKTPPTELWSHSLKDYLDSQNTAERDSMTVRHAIIAIREAKLPDPKKVANNGSFFANPVISDKKLAEIRGRYPNMPAWEVGPDQQKLAAAWLIEEAGFKGIEDEETGMATWKHHALVFVNVHAKSTADLLRFKQKIVSKVEEMFGITLEQEPQILP